MAELQTETVSFGNNGDSADGYLARPKGDDALPGLIVIQEWWGLEEHVKEVTERFADAGYVALAPDLYHGVVVAEPDEAQKQLMALDFPRAIREIQAAITWLKNQPNVEPKKVGVIGFCMGGTLAFQTAIHSSDVAAVAPFYPAGFEPTAEQIAKIDAPILVVYGEHDGWNTTAQVEQIKDLLKETGKNGEVVVYPGAGHAFLNDKHDTYVAEAAQDAWHRAVAFFDGNLKPKEDDKETKKDDK